LKKHSQGGVKTNGMAFNLALHYYTKVSRYFALIDLGKLALQKNSNGQLASQGSIPNSFENPNQIQIKFLCFLVQLVLGFKQLMLLQFLRKL
jgi:hypothetical protein